MTVVGAIAFPVIAVLWIVLMRATRPTPPRVRLTIQRPYDWATEDSEVNS